MANVNYYLQFKSLLEYFVAHLEYLQNSDTTTSGYGKYIQPIKEDFKKTGQGYNGGKIQNQIQKWESYDKHKICITVVNAHGQKYTTEACYLHWNGTNKNIIAKWNDNRIGKLCIKDEGTITAEKNIEELGLYKTNCLNEELTAFFDEFYKLVSGNMDKYIEPLKSNHNIILHGAPGTGKTYLAKEIAKKMNAEFKMVQFHPSYDYTDFVEGLRPENDGNGNIVFKRKDGVFKEFCKKAAEWHTIEGAYKTLLRDISNQRIECLCQKQGGNTTLLSVDDKDRIRWKEKNGNISSSHWAELKHVKAMFNNFVSPNDINDITDINKIEGCAGTQTSNIWAVYNEIYRRVNSTFIFLIDEINRGDMSKIFGELFYAIDPGYRGEKGRIPTQYQNLVENGDVFKEGFYVPDNVYIIGTMNDIDRSVESMDFAMRRRFQFIEVTAESRAADMGLTSDKEAYKRMTSLNQCIVSEEIGLSKAYQIGGAYFLTKDGKVITENFETLWEYRLEGLLREYLRGEEENAIKTKMEILERAFNNDKLFDEEATEN